MERLKSKKPKPTEPTGTLGNGYGSLTYAVKNLAHAAIFYHSQEGERCQQRRYYVGRVQFCYTEIYPGGACIAHLIDHETPPRGEHFANEGVMHQWMVDLLTAKEA